MKEYSKIINNVVLLVISIMLFLTSMQLDKERKENSKLRISAYRQELEIKGLKKEVQWRRYNDSLRRAKIITAEKNRWILEKEKQYQKGKK